MKLYTDNGKWILTYILDGLETKHTFESFVKAKEYCTSNNLPFNFDISGAGL